MAEVLMINQRKNQENGLYATLHLQADKINELLLENERLGSVNRSFAQQVAQLENENTQLKAWYELATKRLQTNDLAVAQQQFNVLWSYVHAMGSPGHRVVGFASRAMSNLWIGRVCKRSVKWLYAIAKA